MSRGRLFGKCLAVIIVGKSIPVVGRLRHLYLGRTLARKTDVRVSLVDYVDRGFQLVYLGGAFDKHHHPLSNPSLDMLNNIISSEY